MIYELTYAGYLEYVPITQEQVIDHLFDKYHSELSVRQGLFVKQNLIRVLEATFRLSRKMSFSKMTVRDLQKETDISMGSLYNCFTSKEVLEEMIIEGVNFITEYCSEKLIQLQVSPDEQLAMTIKGYIYLGRLFKPWYFFIAMESRTMTKKNLTSVLKIRSDFLSSLANLMNGNLASASNISTIIQDFNIRDWKYKNVDIDDFGTYCVKLACLLNQHSEEIGDLALEF